MFRILSNGLAAVGLAAVIALVALMSGSVTTRTAEAAPSGVGLVVTASITCGSGGIATATVATPDVGTTVTFASNNTSVASVPTGPQPAGSGIASIASVAITTYAGMPGSATITATVTGTIYQSPGLVTVTCTGYTGYPGYVDPCLGSLYSAYTVGGCNNYNNCGTLYNAYYGGACANNGCYNSYNSLYGYNGYNGNGLYGFANTIYGNNGLYGNSLYGGCNTGGCNLANYVSCIPATCANAYGPILNCNNNYGTPYTAYVIPGRVSILPGASSISCGSATSITVTVADPNGLRVPDGTIVSFTTTLGYISATDNTTGGTAVTSLTIPAGTAGSARVTASAGGQSADTTVNVTCAQGAPQIVVQPLLPAIQQAIQAIRPVILPPSTGDAGLASALVSDEVID